MNRSPSPRTAGFTLLETIIALAIMVMAFGAILATMSDSINASGRTHRMTIVGMLAKQKMVETEYVFEGKTFDEVKKEDGDSFPDPYKQYRWTSVIKEVVFPNIGGMNGGGGPAAGDSAGTAGAASSSGSNSEQSNSAITDMMSKLVTQFLSKAVREVTVTVFWKNGTKEQSFALTTYWVDLNHEFQLTE